MSACSDDKNYELNLFETILSKMGSRFDVVPQPSKRCARAGVMGFYYDQQVNLTLAAQHEGKVRSLPFTRKYEVYGHQASNEGFERVEQSLGLTYARYRCSSPELPFDVEFTLSAPFYPGDAKLSCAPFIYVIARVTSKAKAVRSAGVLVAMGNPFVVVHRQEPGASKKASSSLVDRQDLTGIAFESLDADLKSMLLATEAGADVSYCVKNHGSTLYDDFKRTGRLSNTVIFPRPGHTHENGLAWTFSLKKNETKEKVFALAAFCGGDVLTVKKVDTKKPYTVHEEYELIDFDKHAEPRKFLYTKYFKNPVDVAAYALKEYPRISKKTDFLEHTLSKSSLRPALKKMLAFSLQSYISNSWWTDGDPQWFTVWEGSCRFHSTVDLSYNCELFALLYWPDLLRLQMDRWCNFVLNDKYIAHDIGDEFLIFGPSYSSDMAVEENCNFLLLLNAYWKFTGATDYLKAKYSLVPILGDFIIEADSDGDGIPDIRKYTVNTVDDASAAVGRSAGLTYLGVKCVAALMAAREMAREMGDEKTARRFNRRAQLIGRTLEERSWQEDHFAVTLDPNQRDVCPLSEVSMHNNNGLLYPLLCDTEVPLDLEKFRADTLTTTERTMGRYGTTHSSIDYTIWFSHNMWRDLVALYLGLDFEDHIDRYWDFQLARNVWDGGCYTDVYRYGRHQIDLDNYPRGTASFGFLPALAGLSIDKPRGVLRLAPKNLSCRLPLLPFASWQRMTMPWLLVDGDDSRCELSISQMATLASIRTLHLTPKTSFKPSAVVCNRRKLPLKARDEEIGAGLSVAGISVRRNKQGECWETHIELSLKKGFSARKLSLTLVK